MCSAAFSRVERAERVEGFGRINRIEMFNHVDHVEQVGSDRRSLLLLNRKVKIRGIKIR